MEYIKHYEDYLFEEIQKHLLELEELTTDVSYKQIVYKIIIDYTDNEDIITSIKQQSKTPIISEGLEYFDYSKNTTKFILQRVLDTIKYIKKNINNSVVDSPQKFFTNVFNKIIIIDKENFSTKSNRKHNVKIDNNVTKTIYCDKANPIIFDSNSKATTVSSKV